MEEPQKSLKFSGHESFVCRHFWPKKGYDFVKKDKKFSNDYAVVDLGVGKNMVRSIQFWMRAINLLTKDNNLTELANILLDNEKGMDPYLEDSASFWLLHYYLIKNNLSSIYSLVFNELRKERAEFTKEQLLDFIKRKCDEIDPKAFNQNTIDRDISVFLRSYLKPNIKNFNKTNEDEISGIFQDLNLLMEEKIKAYDNSTVELFSFNVNQKENLPEEIVLFSILDSYEYDVNLSFKRLEIEMNSPALVFGLNRDGLYRKLKAIESKFENAFISETAGNVVLSFNKPIDKWEVLKNYYAN